MPNRVSERLTMYPVVFQQLVQQVTGQMRKITVPCMTKAEAHGTRWQFYAFRSALRRDTTRLMEAQEADGVMVRIIPGTETPYAVEFCPRERTPLVERITAALEKSE